MSIRHNSGHKKEGNKQGLKITLCITAFIMISELIGGFFSKSLALLSDGGHMLSDFASLSLTLFAMWFAAKPASKEKTYGYYRMEVLAALFNSAVLILGSGLVVLFAVSRLFHPVEISSSLMMIIAAVGLIANITSAVALMKKGDVENNLNVKSAYLHVLSDAFTSFGVIVAGFLIKFFGWNLADPVMSILTSLVILKGAFTLFKNSVHVLMEGTPEEVSSDEIKTVLETVEGVKNVHDLHIWTISSGFDSLSCHLLVDERHEYDEVLKRAIHQIENRFGIRHVTIQLEKKDYAAG